MNEIEKIDWTEVLFAVAIVGIAFLVLDGLFALSRSVDRLKTEGSRWFDVLEERLATVELKTDGMVIRAVPAPGSQPFSIVPTIPPSSDSTR